MLFHKPVTDIIQQRKSIRSYSGTPIEENKKEALRKFLSANTIGPLGTKARFIFITAAPEDRESLRGLITYGMIKNPMGFIIGAVENAHHNLEDFGYLMEKNILMATSLGLGTCWLGGTFSSSGFSRKIALQDNEVLPAVTPVGREAKFYELTATGRRQLETEELDWNRLCSAIRLVMQAT